MKPKLAIAIIVGVVVLTDIVCGLDLWFHPEKLQLVSILAVGNLFSLGWIIPLYLVDN